jgi:hypothetical protein
MGKENIFKNLYRVASDMFTQFSTEEPLISDEAKEILKDSNGREELYNKILKHPKPGEVTVTVHSKDVKFFVEA